MALKDRIGRYQTDTERGTAVDLGRGLEGGTYANNYGDVGLYLDNANTRRNLASAGYSMADDNTMNIGGRMAFPASRNTYNEIDTPFGMFAYGSNAANAMNPNGNVYADFTPRNQYYIQALANLLSRGM